MLKKIGQHVQNLTTRNFAIPVSNGTEALYLSLLVNGIGEGDEVIVPNFSWISSASCISMVGATPVFCDINIDTYHLCMDSVSTDGHIKNKSNYLCPSVRQYA